MSNIIARPVAVNDMLSRLATYKSNPSMAMRVGLDILEEYSDGLIDVVDPTNPFVYLLEVSAMNAVWSIGENTSTMRKTFPSLAKDETDLYMHMSDADYTDRFANPAKTNFTFAYVYDDLMAKLVDDYDVVKYKQTGVKDYNGKSKVIIPRNTSVSVDDVFFSLQYPIVIERSISGAITVYVDTDVQSPLASVETNVIDYTLSRDATGLLWLTFDYPMTQFKIKSVEFAVTGAIYFSEDIAYDDNFYTLRAFVRKANASMPSGYEWVEMHVTHTDQVYDPLVPTTLVKVYNGILTVVIPPVYVETGVVAGTVRFDVYQTRGSVAMVMSNYDIMSFRNYYIALDAANENGEFIGAAAEAAHHIYSRSTVVGGTNGVTFEALKEKVISGRLGDRELPITNNHVNAKVAAMGYDLTQNVDLVTNRVFLASRYIAENAINMIPQAGSQMATIQTSMISIMNSPSTYDVYVNNLNVTLKSGNVFIDNNGVVEMLSKGQRDAILGITDLVERANTINSKHYLYNPFYYVLDNSGIDFDLRAYDLDFPQILRKSFLRENRTTGVSVGSKQVGIAKTSSGYSLTISTKSDDAYKALSDNDVVCQFSLVANSEDSGTNDGIAIINATYIGRDSENERLFTVEIPTTLDFSAVRELWLNGFELIDGVKQNVRVDLDHTCYIIHAIRSSPLGYTPTSIDQTFKKRDGVSGAFIGVSEEQIDIRFGTFLEHLWTNSKSVYVGTTYRRYDSDIYKRYEENVYDVDPNTGSIFTFGDTCKLKYKLLHEKGEYVKDVNGNGVKLHNKGDFVLVNGEKVPLNSITDDRYIDLLLVDLSYLCAQDNDTKAYVSFYMGAMREWIGFDMVELQKIALEKTMFYYYPKANKGWVKIITPDAKSTYIHSEQSLVVNFYVGDRTMGDVVLKNEIATQTIELLRKSLKGTVISLAVIYKNLLDKFSEDLMGIKITGLGGSANYDVITLVDNTDGLSLRRLSYVTANKLLSVKEDITIEFIDSQA